MKSTTCDAAVNTLTAPVSAAHVGYVLRIADSSLILGHRLSEWCGHGPVIEEDIALTNVALDLIGQARALYAHAGAVEGRDRDEDAFAFNRPQEEFCNVSMVALPNSDYAFTILRNFLFTAFQRELWVALQSSDDTALAQIAAKSVKETRYHVQHASDWTVRLGDGTEESHARMQQALDFLWPYTGELFSASPGEAEIAVTGIGPAWADLEAGWRKAVLPLLDVATLQIPRSTEFVSRGKDGMHGEHMRALLSEMQFLQRTYPNCKW